MAREHIVDLDERYKDEMEHSIEHGVSYLGAHGRALYRQNDDDNFAANNPEFFEESGLPNKVADRLDG